MTTEIYRKISLERLASPEQIDHLLIVTDMKSWVALVALALLACAAVFWSFTGSVILSSNGQGVIVKQGGGVFNVVSPSNGNVTLVLVEVGDIVKEGQIVATVAQPVLNEHLRTLRQSLTEAEEQRAQGLRTNKQSSFLQVAALHRQRDNEYLHIAQLDIQKAQAVEQARQEEQLFIKGLITKQQSLIAKAKVSEFQEQLDQSSAQLKQLAAQEYTASQQPQTTDISFRDRIDNIKSEIANQAAELAIAERVVSPYAGQVLERKVDPGSTVHDGEPVLSIQPRSENLELLAYLPSSHVKTIRAGMPVQISPTSIKREEFGYMKGMVIHVSEYPTTPEEMMRNFQNAALVNALTGGSPVTEIRIRLSRDPRSPSGFSWSTSHGPSLALTSGSLCNIEVITQRKRPIELVLPFLKNTLGAS